MSSKMASEGDLNAVLKEVSCLGKTLYNFMLSKRYYISKEEKNSQVI